jgi:hypothetical protein
MAGVQNPGARCPVPAMLALPQKPCSTITSYPACTYTEDIAEQHLNSIEWLVNTSCRNCGGQMAVKTNRKDAWLVCGAPISCGFGLQIAYARPG